MKRLGAAGRSGGGEHMSPQGQNLLNYAIDRLTLFLSLMPWWFWLIGVFLGFMTIRAWIREEREERERR